MDADVYGPSVAMMVGRRRAGERHAERRIVPLERYGIRYVSMALFINDETAVIWRGPMVTKLETEFLFNVEWGELDCLVLDLPPGTGDAQLTITQRVSAGRRRNRHHAAGDRAGSTCGAGWQMFNEVERAGARRDREHELLPLPANAGTSRDLWSWRRRANGRRAGVPFLGELPIVRELREGGDRAMPLVAVNPGASGERAPAPGRKAVLERMHA